MLNIRVTNLEFNASIAQKMQSNVKKLEIRKCNQKEKKRKEKRRKEKPRTHRLLNGIRISIKPSLVMPVQGLQKNHH